MKPNDRLHLAIGSAVGVSVTAAVVVGLLPLRLAPWIAFGSVVVTSIIATALSCPDRRRPGCSARHRGHDSHPNESEAS